MEEIQHIDDKIKIINESPWFSRLPEEAREFLVQNSRVRQIPAGRMLAIRGKPLDSLWGVISGRVRLGETSARGQEVNVGDVVSGGWWGDFALHGRSNAPLDAIALEDSILVVISSQVIHNLGRRWPVLYEGMYYDLMNRTRELLDLFELVAAHPLEVRLAIRLLVLFRDHGVSIESGGGQINVKITQVELASLCYGARQHINRLLNTWSREGFLNVKGDHIQCTDFRKLIAKASESGFPVT
jgi:CRP/FNR family transcriptional regulator, cyclic AMP receptor protein